MDPTFSVIIPTYNRARFLPETILSVQEQVFEQWELIIVDDGSEDNTRQVCIPYLKDERIRYVHQENRELNGARNTGVRHARGAFCCFLDDDDRFLPKHLAALSSAIQVRGEEYGIFRVNMKLLRGEKAIPALPFQNHRDSLMQHWDNPGNLLPLAIKTHLLRQQPFNEEDLLLDDFVWLNEALTKTELFQCEPATVIYVEHDASRTRTYHSLEVLPKMVDRLKQAYALEGVASRVPEKLLKKRIHHLHLHLAHQLSRQGNRSKALDTWFRAFVMARGCFIRQSGKSLIKVLVGYGR
ncbi:glycosyltransferase family 2 protein [Neolewinella persica]|uniref:glycosyltransferase family 2 protein n=1 Tax=Neolewinella persica TaxID=70998 RepID=UPI0003711F5C|nr:glycosyltransferase family A protein [Neolewinella persica]